MAAPEDRKSFLLRIDPRVWREVESWAQEELRSVNGQVEYLLRQAIQKRRGGAASAPTPVPAPAPASEPAAGEGGEA
ncbi:MAG TPA: hypothetical protein DCM86_17350 [Verrucomicrobiales bacterium]|nr:hypothetical protein [Verrucomicrobiales bacterium]